MLVLSRKISESISIPELNISIEVLQVKGKSVRIGVDAPVEIKVLRGELDSSDKNEKPAKKATQTIQLTGESEHDIRNKVNSLNIAVAYAKKLIDRGDFNLAASRLHDTLADLQGNAGEKEEARPFNALLVEDMENEREMLAGFLRLHGYRVDTVADGQAALDYLESNPRPDMIMLDIGMPRLNGAELISRIRNNPSYDLVKLFAISGESPGTANVDVSSNRISKWFQKPLQPAHLVSEINREFTAGIVSNN